MGGNLSRQVVNQTITSINQSMTSMVTKQVNSTSAVTVAANKLTVNLEGAKLRGCAIKIGQKIKAKNNIKAMAKFSSAKEMREKLETALKSQAAQESEQKTQALALGVNISSKTANINQTISNFVQNTITDEVFNETNAYLAANNALKVNMKGADVVCRAGEGIEIDQDIVTRQTVEMLTDTLVQGMVDKTTITEASTETLQKDKQTASGLADIVSSLGLAMLLPCIFCIGLLFVLPGLMKGLGGKKGMFGRRKLRFGRIKW